MQRVETCSRLTSDVCMCVVVHVKLAVSVKRTKLCVIPGCRHEVVENCALLGCYAASSGDLFPMFRDKLSVPFSTLKLLKMGPICSTDTSAGDHHYWLRTSPEELSSQPYAFLSNMCNQLPAVSGFGGLWSFRDEATPQSEPNRNHSSMLPVFCVDSTLTI
jgi:hypothetical protein